LTKSYPCNFHKTFVINRKDKVMERRKFICMAMGGAALGYGGWRLAQGVNWLEGKGTADTGSLKKVSRASRALGTDVRLTVYHKELATAENALTAAFAEIERIEELMSLYRPQSQLCRLNHEARLSNPDPDLLRILRTASRLSERTGGAFDVTVQPLWRLYAEAKNNGTVPAGAALRIAREKVDWRRLEISPDLVRLHGDGMAVTLNGMAQGFATDAACRVLRQHGIGSALIDAGEVGAVGQPLHKTNWTVGIQHPRQRGDLLGISNLKGRCLATSGDYETRFSDDYRFHHLFDPHTGSSPEELASVSVAAPTALQADALSTAAFVLGAAKGRELLQSFPQVDGLFITKTGRVERTRHFPFVRSPQTS
jgi:thiamine biosynthesis lipoprotein